MQKHLKALQQEFKDLRWWKKILVVLLVLIFFNVITGESESQVKTENPQQVVEIPVIQEKTPEPLSEQEIADRKADQQVQLAAEKKKVEAFYNLAMNMDSGASDDAMAKALVAIEQDNGLLAYSIYKNEALPATQKVWRGYSDLEVPNLNNNEHEKKLKEAKESLVISYFSKMEFIRAMLGVLDGEGLSTADKAQQSRQDAQAYLIQGAAGLAWVAMEYGVDME